MAVCGMCDNRPSVIVSEEKSGKVGDGGVCITLLVKIKRSFNLQFMEDRRHKSKVIKITVHKEF